MVLLTAAAAARTAGVALLLATSLGLVQPQVPPTWPRAMPAEQQLAPPPAETLVAAVSAPTAVNAGRPWTVALSASATSGSLPPQAARLVLETERLDRASGAWRAGESIAVRTHGSVGRMTGERRLTVRRRAQLRVRTVVRDPAGRVLSASPWHHVLVVGRKPIALTLDDGPDPRGTPHVLATLRSHNAHATFFMLGRRVHRAPEIVRVMAGDGNQLGDHEWAHVPAATLTVAQFRRSVSRTRSEIREALEATPGLVASLEYPIVFRYPWGASTTSGDRVLRALHMKSYGWTYATGDGGTHGPPSEWVTDLIVRKVLDNARPGSIILMHDGQNRPNSVAALPKILDALTARGYDFVTVSELQRLRGTHASAP